MGGDPTWESALEYYRGRKAVVFLSQGRFWEKHAFPQQSLAKCLVKNGVDVTWLDGYGWRPYRPTLYFQDPRLEVRQLFQAPGARFPFVAQRIREWQGRHLAELIRRKGGNPVVWVQDALREDIAAYLPYVDVFSLFDNPYLHDADGPLCRRAKLLVTQNTYAGKLMARTHPEKTFVSLPPMDMAPEVFARADRPYALPAGFPSPVVGCVGSFMSADFDLDLLEVFVNRNPKIGFVMLGRTDAVGESYIERLRRRSNFLRLPWVPRSEVAAVWKALSCTLLFYRSFRLQDGAFPTRALESAYFDVPCIATRVPKTDDLEGFFPRSNHVDELENAMASAIAGKSKHREFYAQFSREMDPRHHLTRVAQFLRGQGLSRR